MTDKESGGNSERYRTTRTLRESQKQTDGHKQKDISIQIIITEMKY